MDYIHQHGHSGWDDGYRDFQVTGNDVEFAVIILGIFALVAVIF